MGKKSGPPAPDYKGAAEATAQSSAEAVNQQTWANRANQTNPWGSTTWNSEAATDPATGQAVTKWSENTTLDPRLQHALDSQIAMQSGRSDLANSLFPRAQQEFGQQMDWSGLTPWGQGPQAGQLQQTTSADGQGPQQTTSAYGFGPRAGRIQQGLNFGGVQNVDDAATTRSRAEDAIYKQSASRLDPQWDQRRESMASDLANKGISQNSDAYSRAMADFDRSRNDAYSQAQMNAITGGGAEAQRDYGMDLGLRQQQVGEIGQQGTFRNAAQQQGWGQGLQGQQLDLARQQQAWGQDLAGSQFDLNRQQQAFGQNQQAGAQNFNQGLQGAQFQNQMRQQQMAEMMQQRGFSLNEINAIMSGQQVSAPQFGGYNTAGQGQATDYSGAAQNQYSAAMDSQNSKNAFMGNLMQGAGGMASMFAFSDERVKRDVKRIGRHPRGFGVYRYRYVGERGTRIGVMAQEVRRVAPDLVRSVRGVLQVNYAGL